jgi:8-oxo-dGTP pyrophosphatase MutT (NUDIX family)
LTSLPHELLRGTPEANRQALLAAVRALPRPGFLDLDDAAARKAWLKSRIAALDRVQIPELNDGHRLPGRENLHTPAAVLVPIVNRPEGLTLLLTQRSDSLPDHPGQISFPGGRQEPEDRDAAATALRESDEEIGLPPERVEILGVVGRYETVTGYVVTPVAAWVEPPFELAPDPIEVADVFEVPLTFVLDPANFIQREREVSGRTRHYFAVPYGERYIWGATAAMILLFCYVLAAPFRSP